MREYPPTQGCGGDVCEAPRKAAVSDLLALQDKHINTLHQVICKLDSRLNPVLRREPSSPKDTGGEKPPVELVSERIADNNRGIDNAICRIEKLMSLLEI